MIINTNDVLTIGAFLLLAFFQFVTVYFVVSFLSNEIKTRLLYGVSSPFLFILFGFPFYLLGRLDLFAFFQLLIFLLVFLVILKNRFFHFKIIKLKKSDTLLSIFLFIFLVHFLSFEARTHYSYAFRDKTNSHMLIKNIIFETPGIYQPGQAIYLSPVYQILDPSASLDYLGFGIGLVFLVYVFILLEIIKKYSGLYFIVIFSFSIFIQNQSYLIGLSNNQFFILYIPLIFFLIYRVKDTKYESKLNLFLLSVILLSMTITNPSVSFYLGYIFLIFLIALPVIFGFSFTKILFINIMYFLGFGFYLFLLQRGTKSAFSFLVAETSEFSISEAATEVATGTASSKSSFLIWDIVRIKFLNNPFDSFFVAGGYAALLVMIVVFIFSFIKRDFLYFLLSTSGAVFGISTLTGVGQYSFIMGRVGWYFILVVIILVSLGTSSTASKYKIQTPFLILGSFVLVLNSLNPPVHYRFDSEEIHFEVYSLAKKFNQTLYLFSTLYDNRIYHFKKDVILINNPQSPLGQASTDDLSSYLKNCEMLCNTTIVAIDKSTKLPDPILSRAINKELITDEQALEAFYESRNQTLKRNIDLERQLIQEGFIIYFDNENYSILIKY